MGYHGANLQIMYDKLKLLNQGQGKSKIFLDKLKLLCYNSNVIKNLIY